MSELSSPPRVDRKPQAFIGDQGIDRRFVLRIDQRLRVVQPFEFLSDGGGLPRRSRSWFSRTPCSTTMLNVRGTISVYSLPL